MPPKPSLTKAKRPPTSLTLLTLLTSLTFLTLLFSSCQRCGRVEEKKDASLLSLRDSGGVSIAVVADPWAKEKALATYVLVPDTVPATVQLPEGTVVHTPLRRAVLTSSIHAALLLRLGVADAIAGMTDTAYVVSSDIRRLLRSGKVTDVGSSVNPDAERIKQTRADALFLSPMENAGQNNLARLGIPLIQCADYMEVSPLARAEWMRFYGRLFGCADSADSLFREVERAYETLCQKVRTHNAPRPTVFCDLPLSGTWYEPGGQSTMGQYLADAGADYLWSDRAESGSLPLDFEAVYARAARADFWLVKYGSAATLTYDSMLRDDSRFRRFRAWQKRRIWSCNSLKVPFYEETPFFPHLLLGELIRIFHPGLLPEAPNRYYLPL